MQQRINIIKHNESLRLPLYTNLAEHLGVEKGTGVMVEDGTDEEGMPFLKVWNPEKKV